MGILLSIAAYVSAAIFIWRVVWRMLLCKRARPEAKAHRTGAARGGTARAVLDVVFLLRLLNVNPGLWPGELLFHWSFVFVALRHLVYFLDPVPGLVVAVQLTGIVAGYVLPLSILYIFIFRFIVQKGAYVSMYNLYLTVMIFIASISGLLMRLVWKSDLVEIKGFVIRALSLNPEAALPGGWLFWLHMMPVLIVMPSLPAHIFTAPLTIIEARRRDEERPMHED